MYVLVLTALLWNAFIVVSCRNVWSNRMDLSEQYQRSEKAILQMFWRNRKAIMDQFWRSVTFSDHGNVPYCEILPHPDHGQVRLFGNPPTVHSLAIFSCDKGFNMHGANVMKCDPSREWTGEPPKCVAPCTVPIVQNGHLGEYDSRNSFKVLRHKSLLRDFQEVALRCNEGYEPLGKSTTEEIVICKKGVWEEFPTCKPARNPGHIGKPCTIPNVQNGLLGEYDNRNKFKVLPPETALEDNEELVLRCNPGFKPLGKSTTEEHVTCNKGVWPDKPVCKPANLAPCNVPKVQNGLLGEYDDKNNRFKVLLPETSMEDNEQLVLRCNPGFQPLGKKSPEEHVVCNKGVWPDKPICKPAIAAPCSVPKVQNGLLGEYDDRNRFQVLRPETELEDSDQLVLRCNPGFKPLGKSSTEEHVICNKGVWPDKPVCKPAIVAPCTVPNVQNGLLGEYDDNDRFGVLLPETELNDYEQLVLRCNPGFKPMGMSSSEKHVICNKGDWPDKPVCKPANIAPCSVPNVQNGLLGEYDEKNRFKMLLPDTSLSDHEQLVLRCNPGFQPLGKKTPEEHIICNKGDWPDKPICKPAILAPCSVPKVQNGLLGEYDNRNRFKVLRPETALEDNDQLVLRCNPGFKPLGMSSTEEHVICNKGVWPDKPVCKPAITAPCTVPEVQNGLLGEYHGDKRFGVLLPETELDDVEQLVLRCNPGFKPLGKNTDEEHVICNKGVWPDKPVCKPATAIAAPCTIPDVQNGLLGEYDDRNRFKVLLPETSLEDNEKVVLRCNPGFQPLGKKSTEEHVVCNKGVWPDKPICKHAILAPCNVPDVQNGLLGEYDSQNRFKVLRPQDSLEDNEPLVLRCNPGFKPLGKSTREEHVICNKGVWPDKPVCKPAIVAPCTVPKVQNGLLGEYDGNNRFGVLLPETELEDYEKLVLRCHPGFKPLGKSTSEEHVVCNRGVWPDKPICKQDILAPCNVPKVQNGFLGEYDKENNFNVLQPETALEDNEELVLRCNPGFQPLGKGTREEHVVCNKGVWPDKPVCQPANLAPCTVPSVQNGLLGEYDNRNRFKVLRPEAALVDNKKLVLRCNRGFKPLGRNTPEEHVVCSKGHWPDVPVCKSGIDKCQPGNDPCPPHSKCHNTLDGYTCNCTKGYEKSSDGLTCIDIDECTVKNDPCPPNAYCINGQGRYMCDCDTGYYSIDGKTCVDIDECQVITDQCPANSKCNNLIGSWNCICLDGFESTPDYDACVDIDECKANPCPADSRCFNTEGGYTCECDAGFYSPEEKICVVSDQICDIPSDPDNGNVQVDTPTRIGSLASFTCDKGYHMQGGSVIKCQSRGWSRQPPTCVDIDECKEPSEYQCVPHSRCVNRPGYYMCICNSGYILRNRTCQRKR